MLHKYKHNIKKTWEVIKEPIEKGKCTHQNFSRKLKTGSGNITNEELISTQFNTSFLQNWYQTCKKDSKSSVSLDSFLKNCNSARAETPLILNELKDAFFFT